MNTTPRIPDLGEIAPDFDAITHRGEPFRLSQALNYSPFLILIFYRGDW